MINPAITVDRLGLLAFPSSRPWGALGVGGSELACIQPSAGGFLATEATVPAEARTRARVTKAASPDLPEAWVAAVMTREAGLHPDAYVGDRTVASGTCSRRTQAAGSAPTVLGHALSWHAATNRLSASTGTLRSLPT